MTTEYAMPERLTNPYRLQSLGGWIASMLMGILFCIGLPAAITAIAPVTYLRLTRQGDLVSARSQTCLLFVIPFHTQSLENVLKVETEIKAGEMMEIQDKHASSTDRMVRSEDEGTLILANYDQRMKVLVSPANLESYSRDVRDFLEADLNDSRAKSELRKFCVANWKASVLAGVPLTLLTVLFLVCLASPVVEPPIRMFIRFAKRVWAKR